MRSVGMLVSDTLSGLEGMMTSLLLRSASERHAHGIRLLCAGSEADCESFFVKCSAALDTLDRYDHRRLVRFRRDVRAVALKSSGVCYYDKRFRIVFLDTGALRCDVGYLASILVHEGTHARLHLAGVRDYQENQERHELLCVREQRAFLAGLPESDRLLAMLDRTLARRWWTPSARRAELERFLKRYDLPRWYERLLLGVAGALERLRKQEKP